MIRVSLELAAGPLWLYAAILLASVGLAVWSYRHTVPSTTRARRNILITLRSLGLAALLLAIFQPVLSSSTTEKITPSIALIMDNSQSMTLPEKGFTQPEASNSSTASTPSTNASREAAMFQSIHAVIPKDVLGDPHKAALFTVGDHTAPFPNRTPLDSIRADASATDLASAFRAVAEARKNSNLEAIVLYTDGAFTTGENPIYPAQELGVPVYAVGMGDSSEPRDVAVTELFTNAIATVGAAQPVDITIHYGGIKPGEHVTIQLFEEDQKLDEKTIELAQSVGDEAISFQYTPASEGIKKLTARVSPIAGEATEKNNLRITYVKVLKNKFHVVLFAGAPSPDVSFLEQFFSQNPSLRLSTYIQKEGAAFYEGNPTRDSLGTVDLVVLDGFPIASTSDESIALVRELLTRENRSLLFIPSRTLDLNKLAEFGDALPVRANPNTASQVEMQASLSLTPAATDDPLLRLPPEERGKISWEDLAPLFKTESHFVALPESHILATAMVQGVPLGEPLLVTRTIGTARQVALTGYGLWQWKLTSFGREMAYGGKSDTATGTISAMDVFLANSVRWLTTQQENKRVQIAPGRKFYQAGEPIDFFGQVYDESMEPVEHADVSVHITSTRSPSEGAGQGRGLDLALEGIGNGRYSARIPQGLPKGDYSYKGTALLNGRAIGTDEGRFNVGEFNIELAEPRMRSDILRTLAERTGGKFYTPETAANLLKDIYYSPRFQPREITNRRDFELWNSWPLLAFAILCFGTEWFIRKRLGML
ncbi:MAG TPA: hypothetical protein VFH95_04865 [Candidatus Kapabacteria bacterium]|nr:hypothetical protein [Candidatus Kapabacteria bacterium]